MISKEIIYTLILFLFTNVLVWFQLNSQLVWEWAKGYKSMWIMSLMGIPISLLFWWATKIGYQGLGTLWQTRLLAFATSMMIFPLMTWIYLGEVITMKIGASILLAIIIIILQLI
jgi:hypothetical protein|tara:strand:- start:92 stop:436 length:345 start_codon:yes stop_codon:yes gene_type:complete